jgi:hypothetical protein
MPPRLPGDVRRVDFDRLDQVPEAMLTDSCPPRAPSHADRNNEAGMQSDDGDKTDSEYDAVAGGGRRTESGGILLRPPVRFKYDSGIPDNGTQSNRTLLAASLIQTDESPTRRGVVFSTRDDAGNGRGERRD